MMHENLKRKNNLVTPSDRSFGLVITSACVIVALYPLIATRTPHWWLLVVAAILFVLSLVKPNLLTPFNRIWTRFGLILGKFVNPIVLGLMYYLIIFPLALVLKLFGRDQMQRKFNSELETYWQNREPPGPTPGSMQNQY